MKYDFTTVIDRRGMDARSIDNHPYQNVKIKEGVTPIPMWIADMSFATVPTVLEAVNDRLSHPIFGYYVPTDEYYGSIIRWQSTQNGVTGLEKEHILYENGVLGGVSSAIKALSNDGDAVLVHSPCYTGFLNTLAKFDRKVIASDLIKDENGVWRMDYEDMDKKIKENNVRLAIFCSPHNPSGRVWEKEEILAAMEVYKNNDIHVISDEIWSDLTLFGNRHIPTQSVSEDARMRTFALYAPSKTFNLAGLIGSYSITYNDELREKIEKIEEQACYNEMNVLSMHALIGAYKDEGREWLNEVRAVLGENIDYALDFIGDNFPGVNVARPQGTYLLYLDCSEWLASHNMTIDELHSAGVREGVLWQDGRSFMRDNTIRMNLALPKSLLVEAFDRLKKFVFI
ncbi:MAG: aminotransferase class I/II-fold pyridoxal phosphate-dependent enzyme [Oscillospiraceae bacterium]|nr:aminotransferase class I/II-fold pyridoxal phosphate-dependent enzyme [Oscillospiraceae bacterium]